MNCVSWLSDCEPRPSPPLVPSVYDDNDDNDDADEYVLGSGIAVFGLCGM